MVHVSLIFCVTQSFIKAPLMDRNLCDYHILHIYIYELYIICIMYIIYMFIYSYVKLLNYLPIYLRTFFRVSLRVDWSPVYVGR